MLKQLFVWFKENNTPITWWIIGWLSFAIVDQILREHYTMALVNAALIYINYKMWKDNLNV